MQCLGFISSTEKDIDGSTTLGGVLIDITILKQCGRFWPTWSLSVEWSLLRWYKKRRPINLDTMKIDKEYSEHGTCVLKSLTPFTKVVIRIVSSLSPDSCSYPIWRLSSVLYLSISFLSLRFEAIEVYVFLFRCLLSMFESKGHRKFKDRNRFRRNWGTQWGGTEVN